MRTQIVDFRRKKSEKTNTVTKIEIFQTYINVHYMGGYMEMYSTKRVPFQHEIDEEESGAAEQLETAPSLPESNPPIGCTGMSEFAWDDHVGKMKDIAYGFPIEKYSVDDGERKVPNKPQYIRGGTKFTCPMCSNFTCSSHQFQNIGYFHQYVDNHIGENHPNWKELLKESGAAAQSETAPCQNDDHLTHIALHKQVPGCKYCEEEMEAKASQHEEAMMDAKRDEQGPPDPDEY